MIPVVLIDLAHPHRHIDTALKELAEIQSLIKTYGGVDVARIIQHREKPDRATFIGSGKVQELISIVEKEKVSIVIVNALANPIQLQNLTESLWSVNPDIQVWDRIDLILNIFEKHAKTAESRLQIEIARMHHMGNRIYGLGTYFSRQGGGIGTKGLGQTNIERMKLHHRQQIKKKQDESSKLDKNRERQMLRRRENGVYSISIVGYTNAGKSSLFNILTGKNREVQNALFVTLDSVSGKLQNHSGKEILISDTIGFIRNLPPSLIGTFKSTLMESIYADTLLHVIDSSDEKIAMKIETVQQILKDLGMSDKKSILVFNKVDTVSPERKEELQLLAKKFSQDKPLFISAITQEGIPYLKDALLDYAG